MVSYEDIPKFIEFGRVMISPRELYFKNKLVIADKKLHKMGGFITRNLSPHMAQAFSQMIKNEQPDLTKMTPEEAIFYNAYLRKAY
jgi:hypothetical protein